ncbi:MAG: 5-formyltetrahydrofolate cyclo-ligase [Clostridia bacterium]|nr:5-formyltetrahydrofolate cyclo-ligase [Clostridia bacterium]
MEKIVDIRPIKKQLRSSCKEMRRAMDKTLKENYDKKIQNKLLNLFVVREADMVLTYVSTSIEVETHGFINALLKQGKKVAVPKCLNDKGDMDFFIINSFDDLEEGYFGVLEPNPSKCRSVLPTEKTVCVVPAFLFDEKGYRLGYGKGYYDRYLSDFKGTSVGICYQENIRDSLMHGKYDRPVGLIVTEKRIVDLL